MDSPSPADFVNYVRNDQHALNDNHNHASQPDGDEEANGIERVSLDTKNNYYYTIKPNHEPLGLEQDKLRSAAYNGKISLCDFRAIIAAIQHGYVHVYGNGKRSDADKSKRGFCLMLNAIRDMYVLTEKRFKENEVIASAASHVGDIDVLLAIDEVTKKLTPKRQKTFSNRDADCDYHGTIARWNFPETINEKVDDVDHELQPPLIVDEDDAEMRRRQQILSSSKAEANDTKDDDDEIQLRVGQRVVTAFVTSEFCKGDDESLQEYDALFKELMRQVIAHRLDLLENIMVAEQYKGDRAYSHFKARFNQYNARFVDVLVGFRAFHHLKPEPNQFKRLTSLQEGSSKLIKLVTRVYSASLEYLLSKQYMDRSGKRLKPFDAELKEIKNWRHEGGAVQCVRKRKEPEAIQYDDDDPWALIAEPPSKKHKAAPIDRPTGLNAFSCAYEAATRGNLVDLTQDRDGMQHPHSQTPQTMHTARPQVQPINNNSQMQQATTRGSSCDVPSWIGGVMSAVNDNARALKRIVATQGKTSGPVQAIMRFQNLVNSDGRGVERFSTEYGETVDHSVHGFSIIQGTAAKIANTNPSAAVYAQQMNAPTQGVSLKKTVNAVEGDKTTSSVAAKNDTETMQTKLAKAAQMLRMFVWRLDEESPQSPCQMILAIIKHSPESTQFVRMSSNRTTWKVFETKESFSHFVKIWTKLQRSFLMNVEELKPQIVSQLREFYASRSIAVDINQEFRRYTVMMETDIYDWNLLAEEILAQIQDSRVQPSEFWMLITQILREAMRKSCSVNMRVNMERFYTSMYTGINRRSTRVTKPGKEWLCDLVPEFEPAQLDKEDTQTLKLQSLKAGGAVKSNDSLRVPQEQMYNNKAVAPAKLDKKAASKARTELQSWLKDVNRKLAAGYAFDGTTCAYYHHPTMQCVNADKSSCKAGGKTRKHECLCGASDHKVPDCKSIWK